MVFLSDPNKAIVKFVKEYFKTLGHVTRDSNDLRRIYN